MRKLLIVDDEPNILTALKRTLQEDGYQIYTANSGMEGLKILAESESPIQVVLSDQRMPNMAGSEFLTRVKELYPHTVRIILSAYSDFDALKDAINNGAIYKFLNKPWEEEALRMQIREAFKITSKNIENENKITWLLDHDKLTGLQNRFLFSQQLEKEINHAQVKGLSLALIAMNIDQFNKVNYLVGEKNADMVLQQLSDRLKLWLNNEKNMTRSADKFYLIEILDKDTIDIRVKDLIMEINKTITVSNTDFHLRASIGVSLYPDHGNNYNALMKHAYDASLASKKLSGNTYQIYNPLSKLKVMELISEQDLYTALEHNQFIVYYQPIVDANTSVIKGAEALVRWQHPKYGFLPPDSFISVCEENGLIIPLGFWVMQAACHQLKQWRDKGHDLFIAVNLSPRQLREAELLDKIHNLLLTSGVPPQCLEIEITESVMMQDLGCNMEIMNKLSDLSIKVSIDDFGTGYSSLSYLKNLPIHLLKIDKSFIDDIVMHSSSIEILKAIILMAKSLGLKVIAEGVEAKEQLDILKAEKCDFIQGYYYSKPVTAIEFQKLLGKTFSRSD